MQMETGSKSNTLRNVIVFAAVAVAFMLLWVYASPPISYAQVQPAPFTSQPYGNGQVQPGPPSIEPYGLPS